MNNIYLIFLLLGSAWVFHSISYKYAVKNRRFAKVGRIKLYLTPFIYILTVLAIQNMVPRLKNNTNFLVIIFLPFIFLSAFAVAETTVRLENKESWFIIDHKKIKKSKQEDFINNFDEYKEMVIKNNVDISKLSKAEIFELGRKMKYEQILKINKKRKK